MEDTETTYVKRYRANMNFDYSLYESYLQEDLRVCIHLLNETGRDKGIFLDGIVVEDEEHAMYMCDAYRGS